MPCFPSEDHDFAPSSQANFLADAAEHVQIVEYLHYTAAPDGTQRNACHGLEWGCSLHTHGSTADSTGPIRIRSNPRWRSGQSGCLHQALWPWFHQPMGAVGRGAAHISKPFLRARHHHYRPEQDRSCHRCCAARQLSLRSSRLHAESGVVYALSKMNQRCI